MTSRRGHGLGRRAAKDDRDALYPLRTLIPLQVPDIGKFYATGPVLDQGATPRCVAFAWKQWLDSSPIRDKEAADPAPLKIYQRAQELDEWPGEAYDGTSVRAGAKVMEELGRLVAYHWSTSADDVHDYLITTSTVVFGVAWYEDMFNPSKSGFIKPTGALAGGHAFLCIGYSKRRGAFRFVNSWGSDWGDNGRFWMTGESVQTLLDRDGEACAALEVKPAA